MNTTTKSIIRIATTKDKQNILSLLNQLGKVEDLHRGNDFQHTQAHVLGDKMYDELIQRDDYIMFVSLVNENIVAVLTLHLMPYVRYGMQIGYIIDLVVDDYFRGQGIGSQIFCAARDYCKQRSIKKLYVGTSFLQAQHFYKSLGGATKTKLFSFQVDAMVDQ